MALSLCVIASFSTAVISDPQPPIQDQCHAVNATEPRECPNHIGPPCPPCYINDQPDYTPSDDLAFSEDSKAAMRDVMQWYIDWWPQNYPPSKTASGYNIFAGSAGRAQLHLRLYNHTLNASYLTTATAYINHAVSLLPSRVSYGSYMFGHAGVWMLAAIIADLNGDTKSQQTYLGDVVSLYGSVAQGITSGANSVDGIDLSKCGLDEGLSGMLFGALFINEYYQRDIVSVDAIKTLTFYVLDEGIASGAALHTNYLQYECPFIKDCYLWGPGHGATGVLHTVYAAYAKYPTQLKDLFADAKYFAAVQNTMDFFVSIQLADGNMPTNTLGTCQSDYGTDPDARVQWCHGAPGFVNVFSWSAQLFASYNASAAEGYLRAAWRSANATFARGLLAKGTMFCHGIGGNTNMLWEFGQRMRHLMENGDAAFLAQLAADGYDLELIQNESVWRAKQFALWTLDWENVQATRLYDSNEGYSFYQGNFALPAMYIQMLDAGWPFEERVCHPGWGLCL